MTIFRGPQNVSVLAKTVLPPLLFDHNSGATVNAWPPQQPNIGLAYSEMISHAIRNAPPPPSEAERIAESARHIAAGEERERESERLRSLPR
jgi:hypothetical protein